MPGCLGSGPRRVELLMLQMQSLILDFIYGMRWLRKHPAFTALTVLTLGVGIGVNTAMFSVINAVILRPLPYRKLDRANSAGEVYSEI